MTLIERANSHKKVTWLSLVGLVVIPALIAGGLLWANWNPQDRFHTVNAAIVNLDESVTLNGQTVLLGRQLAAGLMDTSSENADSNFTWSLETADGAADGIKDGTYVAAITIPKGFSKAATSFSGTAADATQATIEVTTSSVTALADPTVAQAVSQVAVSTLNKTLTTSYLDNVYVGFNTLSSKLSEMSDGASQLASAGAQVDDGTSSLASGLASAGAGASSLASGASSLDDGASGLAAGAKKLSSGASQLASGTKALDSAISKKGGLADGISELADGSSSLASGLGGLASAVGAPGSSDAKTLAGATSLLAAGVGTPVVSGAPSTAPKTLTETSYALATASKGYAAYYCGPSGNATLCSQFTTIAQLAGGLDSGADGTSGINGGSGIAAALAQLSASVNSTSLDASGSPTGLAAGITALETGAASLSSGLASLDTGVSGKDGLAASVTTLAKGASGLATGTKSLTSGASSLASGADGLSSGASSLVTGVASAADGAGALADGTSKLSSGLGSFASGVESGASSVPTYSESDRSTLASVVATPVTTAGASSLTVFGGYSAAGLLIVIALWIGAIATYLVVRPLTRRAVQSSRSSVVLMAKGLWPALLVATGATALLTAIATSVLTLDAGTVVALATFTLASAVVFVFVNYALVAAFGGIGRFVAVAMAVLGAATMVISGSPEVFQFAATLSPLTPAIRGFAAIASGGSGVGAAIAALIAWLVIGLVLGFVAVSTRRQARPGTLEAN